MKHLKPAFIALLILLSPYLVSAQNVVYSQYDKFDFRAGEYAVVGVTGGLLYTYRSGSDGAMLDAYDDSMTKIATVLLDFFPEKIYSTRFVSYPDKIIVLYQALESNKVVQYAALLDEKGRLKNRPVELGSFKTGIFGANKDYFASAVSDDKKRILIYSAGGKSNEVDIEAKWLDDNLTILKRSKASFRTNNSVQHGDMVLANDGVAYMPAYTPVGALAYADQYFIMILQPGATKFEAKELPLSGKFATSGYFRVDNHNNKLYFGGFYSDKKNGNFDGIVFAAYDIASAAFLNAKCIPFDNEMLSAAGGRKRNRELDNYEVKQLIVKNDGGFVMISEIHFVTSRSNYSPGMGTYSFYGSSMSNIIHEYHYNDIMSLSYNKDGIREWGSYIPKQQYSQEDGGVFSSYSLLNTGGTLAFLFNDFNIAHSHIQLATVAADGKTDIHAFTAEGNDYPDWLPRSGKQVAARVLVVPCLHKKQLCFARVMF